MCGKSEVCGESKFYVFKLQSTVPMKKVLALNRLPELKEDIPCKNSSVESGCVVIQG